MEERVKAIICKVKDMFKYDNRVKDFLSSNPRVILDFEDDVLVLKSVNFFSTRDTLSVLSNKIIIRGEDRDCVLLEYSDFDDLLSV